MPQEKKSEIDAAREAVWDLVSKALKKHTLNYIHVGAGHGQPAYDAPDGITSCKKHVDIEKVDKDGITWRIPLGGLDDSQPCTCGADEYNKSLRDIADSIIAVLYGEAKGK